MELEPGFDNEGNLQEISFVDAEPEKPIKRKKRSVRKKVFVRKKRYFNPQTRKTVEADNIIEATKKI